MIDGVKEREMTAYNIVGHIVSSIFVTKIITSSDKSARIM